MIKIYTKSIFIISLLLASMTAMATTISIDPKSTFLRTNNDPAAVNSISIELASLGLGTGDYVRLEQLGDLSQRTGDPDIITGHLLGVFSNTNILLGSSTLNRVQDAIDAGNDESTGPTFFGNLPNDIAEDFLITNTLIQIPAGAAYLFVAASDSYYSDNSDLDGDYGMRITQVIPVPLPDTIWLISLGLLVLIRFDKRKPETKS